MQKYNMSKIVTHSNLKCDVLVSGGGIAGVCAAIAAARNGAKVILCQDRSVLGGNASSEIRMHICGADRLGKRGQPLSVEARESGIIEEIRLENAVRNPQRSWSMGDLILYEKCMAETNLTLLLDTTITSANTENRKITSVCAQRQFTEDIFTIEANIYVDCTGDGRLAAEAGASSMRGRESKSAFNEDAALQDADKREMGMSLLFESRDVGHKIPFSAPHWARKFTDEELSLRDCTYFNYGYWWIEWGGEKDTIKDYAIIRHKLLEILLGVWDYIKNSGKYDADNYALDWFGFLPGKRQSRRICGLYVLTENDIVKPKGFIDTIAYGGWPLDRHPPKGIDAKEKAPATQTAAPYLYPIPLRSCISRDIDNLMMAGRNISASYIAFASSRVMATCGVIGQGTGTAAAYAAQNGIDAVETVKIEHIRKIQLQLQNDDCFLPGINLNQDNLVNHATITASSYTSEGDPENIKTPLTRSVNGKEGVCPEMAVNGTHRWISSSRSEKSEPEWIEMSWVENVTLSEIRLVFDTGLHRPLSLSHDKASGIDNKMIWSAQPETVKDYKIFYKCRQGWELLTYVTGNYQRVRMHKFDSINTNKLRVVVEDTNGLKEVRICKIIIH